ncbi:MAG: FAD-dependent oxidoreductase [Treponemataceae bacterium]
MSERSIVIIGGGGTGAATAYDLSLRGYAVTLLERGELTSGTTGRHHGQLHSGARYALGDVRIARECMDETLILRRIAPNCMEYNQGLFLALTEEDAGLADEFVEACRAATIPAEEIPISRALAMESALNPAALRAVIVPDGTIDAYRLAMSFFAAARIRGADIRTFTEATEIERSGGCVTAVRALDLRSGAESRFPADVVVNCGGPWAGKIGSLAGIDVPLTAAPGSMVAVEGRLTDLVISHLHRAGDGDIIVPQRKFSIIGSTQRKTDDPDGLAPPEDDIRLLLSRADQLIPGFSSHPIRAAWSAARPLAGRSNDDGRNMSRDVSLIDHGKRDGLYGFFTIIGGKATVLRAMGEAAAAAVEGYLEGVAVDSGGGPGHEAGLRGAFTTADLVLPSYRTFWKNGGRH